MPFPFPSAGYESLFAPREDDGDRRRDMLANALISLGAGMTHAGSQGRPFWEGIAPGAAMFSKAQGEQAQHEETRALRNWQISLQAQALKDKEDERRRLLSANETYAAGLTAPTPDGTPTMRAPAAPLMGPGEYGPPNPNNIGNVRPPGSSTGFQQPASFEDGVALTVNNARAYPQAFNNGQPMTLFQIGEKWAPKGDGANDPAQWARNVAQIGGLDPNKPLDLNDPQTATAFARGVHGAEKGAPAARPAADYLPHVTRVSGDAAPTLADVPRPTAPPELRARLGALVRAGAISPKEAESELNKFITDQWGAQREAARAKHQQDSETYRFNRGQTFEKEKFQRGLETEGEWVRGADGVERFTPKTQRSAGMTRTDKPPLPGTETGDIHVLTNGDPSTPEYAGAYNRIRTKLSDGPDGLKYAPDMVASGYRPPTFKQAAAGPAPSSAPGGAADSTPPGLVPVGVGKERKYTESQSKDHIYVSRLNEAIPQLEALVTNPDGSYSTSRLPSWSEQQKANSKYYPEDNLGEKAKEFRRIIKNVMTATLRQESGATINDNEFVSEAQKFIPQPGDTPGVIQNKLKALRTAAQAMGEGTGRDKSAYPNLFGQQQTAAPQGGTIKIDMSGRRQ